MIGAIQINGIRLKNDLQWLLLRMAWSWDSLKRLRYLLTNIMRRRILFMAGAGTVSR